MQTTHVAALFGLLVIHPVGSSSADESRIIRPVAAHRVTFTDGFWRPRLEINRTVTIPYSFRMCEETGRIENFRVAAGLSDKKWTGIFGFNDSDVTKIAEGAAYSLMTHPDAKLDAYLDDLIATLAAAQEDDGYLTTAWTARDKIDVPEKAICRPVNAKWLEESMSHELYNLGHMFEAAAAHYEATGKTNFLDVAKKSAELLFATFGEGKMEVPPGHPEVELGLIKLYHVTDDRRYLDLAKFFIELRGKPTDDRPKLWGEYSQDHKPFREQGEAVGHAVRATYLYAAATDVAALTDDQQLADTVNRLWENVVRKKQYVTGGIGATGEGEAFGKNYDLPNQTAYAETCANIADCMWAHRLFLLQGESKFIDVLERTLYNSTISGVSLDGKDFFYPNPLESNGQYARSNWFDCSCCPTNLCRFIPSVPGYAYAVQDDAAYVNLFVEGSAELELADGTVTVEQRTKYPWDGRVEIVIEPAQAGQRFSLRVRIPGWAVGEAWPSDLYTFLDKSDERATLAVNGESVKIEPQHGYAVVDREWQPGDRVTLELPMPVRRVVANEQVEADRGRVALMRGPIVYCIEAVDVEGSKARELVVPDVVPLETSFRPELLGGIQVVTGMAQRPGEPATTTPFTAVPYCNWANRAKGEMIVWLARTHEPLKSE